MIRWYRECAREDADPQLFDSEVGHLFLRVVEIEQPHGYRWAVSAHEHPPFEDEVNELSLAMGNHVTEQGAKGACRRAVQRLLGAMERDL